MIANNSLTLSLDVDPEHHRDVVRAMDSLLNTHGELTGREGVWILRSYCSIERESKNGNLSHYQFQLSFTAYSPAGVSPVKEEDFSVLADLSRPFNSAERGQWPVPGAA